MFKIGTLLTILLGFVIGAPAQDSGGSTGIAAEPDSVEVYLARDDGTGQAGQQATSFVTTDVPIYCVVQLGSSDPVTVKMNLVAVSVAGVKAETRVVSTTYTTRDNQDRVNFTGRPAGQWVPGRYRVDIFIGNKPAMSREFAVQKATHNKPVSKPQNSKASDKSRYAGRLKKN